MEVFAVSISYFVLGYYAGYRAAHVLIELAPPRGRACGELLDKYISGYLECAAGTNFFIALSSRLLPPYILLRFLL